ncbi:MAG: hypothetical protein N4A54_07990 [Peptostreptococcaceae bacterium]|nr:hypothetical protein [Peptostreptococcaceae bacterium]
MNNKYALFLILNDVDKLDVILEKLFEIKVGATVVDGVGMSKMLIDHDVEIPLFSSIRKLIDGDRPFNKIIMSVIRDENKLNTAKDIIMKELDGIKNPGVGFMFIMPVIECYGFGV